VGGAGGFDYVYADAPGRKLYVARSGGHAADQRIQSGYARTSGEIPGVNAHGAVVSEKDSPRIRHQQAGHDVRQQDARVIKTIAVEGNPDGFFYDPFNDRVWILSHAAPNATLINASDGSIAGHDRPGRHARAGGQRRQGTRLCGHRRQGNIAVVDAKTMTVTAHYELEGKGGTCAGLPSTRRTNCFFAACRNPQNMVISQTQKTERSWTRFRSAWEPTAPSSIRRPKEAFSSQADGTLTIVKENSPTSFAVEQNLTTMTTPKR